MIGNVVYLDLETTGLNKGRDEIIEIGALKICDGEEHEYNQLINPRIQRIPPTVFDLCKGLTETELRASPSFEEIMDSLLEFIGDYPIICHNARFDRGFLEAQLGKLNNIFLDSLELFVIFKPHLTGHGLSYLYHDYFNENPGDAHRALQDAIDTRKIVEKLLKDLCLWDADLLEFALLYMKDTDWSWLPFLRELPISPLRHTKERAIFNDGDGAWGKGSGRRSVHDIEEILKDEGRWGNHLGGYEFKPHQLDIARAITDVFENEQILFAEAPTGSGKTLPYLLTALLWSIEKKERVFISTNTKNLQKQIQEELPKVSKAIGFENVKTVDLKGIANYSCKAKINDQVGEKSRDLDAALAKLFLNIWSLRTPIRETENISFWFRMNN